MSRRGSGFVARRLAAVRRSGFVARRRWPLRTRCTSRARKPDLRTTLSGSSRILHPLALAKTTHESRWKARPTNNTLWIFSHTAPLGPCEDDARVGLESPTYEQHSLDLLGYCTPCPLRRRCTSRAGKPDLRTTLSGSSRILHPLALAKTTHESGWKARPTNNTLWIFSDTAPPGPCEDDARVGLESPTYEQHSLDLLGYCTPWPLRRRCTSRAEVPGRPG